MDNAAGPTTFKAPDLQSSVSQIPKNYKGWFKSNLAKTVIAVLVIGVLAEVIFGGFSLFAPSVARNLNPLQPAVNEMTSARLSLIPEKLVYKNGETVVVEVKLFTGGYNTDSTDLVVKYDPSFLKPDGKNFAAAGKIYSEYPAVQVDEKNGLIGISGITTPGSGSFLGVGDFAKLNFIAIKNGQTQVSIDYNPDSTADSNVVLSGSAKDILGVVDNAAINISDTASDNANSLPESCGSFTQYCQISPGTVGTQVCNAGTIKESSCGYDPRLTASCEECKI